MNPLATAISVVVGLLLALLSAAWVLVAVAALGVVQVAGWLGGAVAGAVHRT